MNRTETRRSKQRQISRPSNLLNDTENAFIHQNLQNRQIAQATAVVELLQEDQRKWNRIATGGLCFVKDSHRRSYFLSFFQIQQEKHKPIWEQEIYESINAINQRPFFIQFSANDRQIGLNFADQSEAQEVFNLIKEKSKPKTTKNQSGLTVKPLQQYNRMTNQHQSRGNDAIIASQEPVPQKQPNKKGAGINKSMIGAPTDFRHIEGAKIGKSGRMEQVKADIRKDDDMKKLLMDMNLIETEDMFDKILSDDKVKDQIYGYIESVGGINRARQSIRQPPGGAQPRVPMTGPPMLHHGIPPPPPPVNEHRTIHNQNQPPKPPNRRESIRETTKPSHINSNRPPPPPPPGVGRPRPPQPNQGRPNMPPPPPKPSTNRPPPPPLNVGPPGGPPGPPPPPPPAMGPPPPMDAFPPPPMSGGAVPSPIKQVQREAPERNSRNALFDEIKGANFRNHLQPVDTSTSHAKPAPNENSGDIQATLAGMLQNIRKDIASDDEEDDDDEWSD